MAIIQLTPFEVITPLGEATALFLQEVNPIVWGVCQKETGEMWWWENRFIRIEKSITNERYKTTPILLTEEMKQALEPHKGRYGRS